MTATAAVRTDTPPPRAGARPMTFRPDIEGLRAVAVGLVLLYHAGLRWIPGGFVGVDVFFVISGFLITGVILREVAETGRLSLVGFYARRAKRLLPAAAAVLVTSAVLTAIFLPQGTRSIFGGDVAAAAAYVVNWRLADRSVDYLAEDVGASPVQHFWSLAVEEQFYVVWPLLIIALLVVLRRRATPPARRTVVLTIGLACVSVPSFVWALALTARSPNVSFFVTTTRLWELGIGAGVALGLALWQRIGRSFAVALGLVGLVAVVASAFLLDHTTAWPGTATLLPTLGTAAVIVAGAAGHTTPVTGLLSWRPMVWIGGLSYSLYLWHWPLIVVATERSGGSLSPLHGLAVVAGSLLPAWLSYRLLEHPIRSSPRLARRPGLALSIGANCTLVGVVAGLVLMVPVASSAPPPTVASGPGASILTLPGADLDAIASASTADSISPDPSVAIDDAPQLYFDRCQMTREVTTPTICSYGAPDGTRTMFMVGDSKVAQWQPALEAYAEANDWELKTLIKSSCTMSGAMLVKDDTPDEPCHTWGAAASETLLAAAPDLVVYGGGTSMAMVDPTDLAAGLSREALADGIADQLRLLVDAGITVVVLLDNPSPGKLAPVYECVADNREALDRCAFDRAAGIDRSAAPAQLLAAERVPGVRVLDMTDTLCPTELCPAVIGDTLVYRQGSHVTTTYVATTTPQLTERMDALLTE